MPAKRGRPSNAEVSARGKDVLRTDSSGNVVWDRADGRSLFMPWTLNELWARLCCEAVNTLREGGNDAD